MFASVAASFFQNWFGFKARRRWLV